MNKAKKILACILVIVMAAGSLAGCTTFDNFKKAFLNKNPENDAQILIGVYEPMTGSDKEAGEEELKGIELAHKLYPDFKGAKIELIYADNKSDMEAAETAITDLMKKNPTVVLGSYGNINSLIAGEYLDEAKVPGIAITNTNPLVTKNSEYYFRVCLVDTYEATAMARYVIEELDQEKAGILLPAENEQALAMASNFENYIVEKTGNDNAIVVYKEYEPGSGDFTGQLQAIKDSGVKSVYVLGDLEDTAGILEQAHQLNMNNVLFMGDSTWGDKAFIKQIRPYVDGNIAFTTLFSDAELVTDMSESFVKEYKAEYGEEPTPAAALGFDSYMVVMAALEIAGPDCTGEELRDALLQVENFHGASGIITFDSTGNPKKTVVINTVKNNKVEALCTIAPAGSSVKSDKDKADK